MHLKLSVFFFLFELVAFLKPPTRDMRKAHYSKNKTKRRGWKSNFSHAINFFVKKLCYNLFDYSETNSYVN